MEIKQLRAFLAVADAKSFLKAADDMFISRQAISKTIKLLEDELETELFVRNQNGAMMTPAGIFLYPRASALIAEFDKLKSDTMDIRRSYRQTIRIQMAQGIYGHYAGSLMEYGEKYSSELELITKSCLDSDCETILTDRKADAVLSFTKINENVAISSKLMDSPLMFLINNDSDLLQREKVGIRDFLKTPMLLYTSGQGHCLWWYDYPKPRDLCCSDLNYLFTLLKENKGVLPIPKIAIPPFLDFATCLPAPESVEPVPVYYSTLYPDHYTTMAFRLLDDLQENIFTKG